MRRSRLRVAGVVLVAALGGVTPASAAAPAATDGLPTLTTRRSVERLVHTTYPELPFGNVACPAAVSRTAGTTFSCTVQVPGAFLVVDGTVTRSAKIRFHAAQAVLATTALEQFVATNASLPATVDCGPAPFQVARPGQVIACAVGLADGTTRTAELTVADAAGAVTITRVT